MTPAPAARSLGHGIGLRHAHFAHLLEHGVSGVDWFEVVSENFFEPGGRPWAVLERVRAEVPVVLHGVSMGLGNLDPVPPAYLARLRALAARVEPAWISDHLCWGALGRHHGHDLWPLPYTEEALDHVVSQIDRVQTALGRRLLIENVSSYVEFTASSMTEWDFVAEVARRADCDLLLDVNNVYVSSRNHGFSAAEYLDAIPAERIRQIHLAGHSERDGRLVDTHLGPVPDPVWELFAHLIGRVGPVATLVEWDEATPDYQTVVAESRRAADLEARLLGSGRAAAAAGAASP